MGRNNSNGLSCTMVSDNQDAGNIIQTCNCGIDDGDLLSWPKLMKKLLIIPIVIAVIILLMHLFQFGYYFWIEDFGDQ